MAAKPKKVIRLIKLLTDHHGYKCDTVETERFIVFKLTKEAEHILEIVTALDGTFIGGSSPKYKHEVYNSIDMLQRHWFNQVMV